MSIEIKNVSYIYSKDTVFEKKAIDNISLTIEDGEFFAVIGHTGSGKSTLIQHLNAILKPHEGEVIIDGININSSKEALKNIRQKVGLVFQYPEYQLFETSVYRDVAFGPTNLGLSKDEIDIRVTRALELVGVDRKLFDKSPFDLSGGQKRRVAIAGVLAMEPKVLILDEPTAGLDPKGRDDILRQIRHFHEILNNTIIIVSHSMEDVSRLAQKIAVLDQGKLKYMGEPKDVFKNAYDLEKIGLSAPQMSYLIRLMNKNGFHIDENLFTVDDVANAIYEELK